MKRTITILSLLALTACTATPEMIAAQQGRCTQLGYQPGTIEHAQCAERGSMQQQQAQNAVLGATAPAAASAAIINAIWY